MNLKPTFLLECRKKFDGDILYIDADAYAHQDCRKELAELNCDIAHCRCRDYITGTVSDRSGTVLIKDTPKALKLLELWKIKSDLDNSRWDQATLSEAIDEVSDLKVHHLDYKYTYIFDGKECTQGTAHPVIEHLQASRLSGKKRKWYHKLINKKSKRAKRTLARTKELENLIADGSS